MASAPYTVEFVDELPASLRARIDWTPIATELKRRKNKWALLGKRSYNSAAGAVRKALGDGFEAAVRRNGEGFGVYARYVG